MGYGVRKEGALSALLRSRSGGYVSKLYGHATALQLSARSFQQAERNMTSLSVQEVSRSCLSWSMAWFDNSTMRASKVLSFSSVS